MPDEPKPPLTPPQAGWNLDRFREEFRRSNLDKQLREKLSRSNLDKFCEEFRRSELDKQPREEFRRSNWDKQLREELSRSNLDKFREEFRRSELDKQPREEPSRANLEKPCAQPNNSNLDKSREEPSDADNKSEQTAPAKPKQRRVKIPHVDEAIEQMLAEQLADPDKFQLKKERVGRVFDILQKTYRVTVPKSQERTLGRWIDIALSGQT